MLYLMQLKLPWPPSGISIVKASCIPLSAQTALQALRDHCKVAPGLRC
jgi:NADPH:quinone reductase-like Zn-dependent oxidoreductase